MVFGILTIIRVVIVEGMFLLLSNTEFKTVKEYLDLGIFLEVPLDLCHERLNRRRTLAGRCPIDSESHFYRVDAPNSILVEESKVNADFVLEMKDGLVQRFIVQKRAMQ
jgi:pantothenate kinase